MPVVAKTVGLLILSNIFMTFAWYAHLRHLSQRPWIVAALVSWGIALFEYLLQVPANRIGYTVMSLGQLKILQEAITLVVFVPFAILYMMSYLFRSANAVISPELTRDLALDPASLGLLTSAYFLGFGLMQVP